MCGIFEPDDQFNLSGNIIAYVSSEDWSLYYMNIDTGAKKKITDEVFGGLRWSHDGSMIAFNSLNFFNGLPTNDFPLAVYIANADGSGKRIVTLWERKGIIEPHPDGGNNPVWSPDNSRIAFSKCINCEAGGTNSEIYIIDIDTTGGIREKRLTNNPVSDHISDWSPDGSKILFKSDWTIDGSYDEVGDLYTMNSNGLDKNRVLIFERGIRWGRNLRYSPDGKMIALISGIGNQDGNEIYIMNADGSDLKKITDNNINESDLSWSPDGKRIVFIANDPNAGGRTGAGDLYIINVDGTGLRRLTNDGNIYYSAEWRPW